MEVDEVIVQKASSPSAQLQIFNGSGDLELSKLIMHLMSNLSLPLILDQRVLQVSVKKGQGLLEKRLLP